jgi:DNA modification methylase
MGPLSFWGTPSAYKISVYFKYRLDSVPYCQLTIVACNGSLSPRMTVQILQGDCRDLLKTLPDESVDCVVTSPPYWRQRDYGMPTQIGLERTPEEYIAALVSIFRDCRRLLRATGTCWVNLGEKWASGGNGGGGKWMVERGHAWDHAREAKGWRSPPPGYKDKDLVGIPWMFAFAARGDGWYLRQCNVWAKPNCMPESVLDRTTLSHEFIFHLSKSNDYWYDARAVRTPATPGTETRLAQSIDQQSGSTRANAGMKTSGPMKAVGSSTDANLRSVWWISPAQCREAHYAVMPERIAEICIRAGCPMQGTVLDPFGGVGTTGLVADRLGRNAILLELNPRYADIAKRRIFEDAPLFVQLL